MPDTRDHFPETPRVTNKSCPQQLRESATLTDVLFSRPAADRVRVSLLVC